jgi:hypothetical protein
MSVKYRLVMLMERGLNERFVSEYNKVDFIDGCESNLNVAKDTTDIHGVVMPYVILIIGFVMSGVLLSGEIIKK